MQRRVEVASPRPILDGEGTFSMHHTSWDGPVPIFIQKSEVTDGASCSDTSRDHGTSLLDGDKTSWDPIQLGDSWATRPASMCRGSRSLSYVDSAALAQRHRDELYQPHSRSCFMKRHVGGNSPLPLEGNLTWQALETTPWRAYTAHTNRLRSSVDADNSHQCTVTV